MALEPVQLPATYELITDRLRRAIHMGEFPPGEQLPTERELASQLGVSRVTLREALRTLEATGYIDTARGPRGGSVVTADLNGRLRVELVAQLETFDHLMGLREVLEFGSARLAAENPSEESLEAIRRALDDTAQADSVGSFWRADTSFHNAVAAAAGNPLLSAEIEDVRGRLFSPSDALPFTVVVDTTYKGHKRVVEAIERRHPQAAGEAMAEHIREAHRELRAALLDE